MDRDGDHSGLERASRQARTLRIAAAGDLHCCDERRESITSSLRELAGKADVVLLCGDLTTHGEPQEAAVLAEACGPLPMPVFAVLGNHDWHANRHDELVAEHEPDLVLHGHAHSGTFEGTIGSVPVYNVSVPVMGRDFWLFELEATATPSTPIH